MSAGLLKNIKKYWADFKESQLIYRELFENAIDGMYISNLEGQYVEVNNSLVRILGYKSKKELLKVNTKDLYFNREDRPDFNNRNRTFGTCLKKKDCSKIYVEISSGVIYRNGRPEHYEGIVRDKTEYKKYEEKIKYLSFHDALTGLYNWAYFDEQVKRLRKTRRLPLTIIMGDVDSLKYVNDTFGHRRGNSLIRNIADILRDNFRSTDVISRIGGDEFCIILPDTTKDVAENIIKRINRKCAAESSEKIPVSISFGISEKKNADMELGKVLEDAESSMYKDKKTGKPYYR
jgi:diguanylate cyclase (GGDEF)-like protein/PAS domain S-box-containing protein